MRALHIHRLLLIIFSVLLIAGCNNEDEPEQQERTRLVAVETITMEAGSFEDFIRLTGTVEAFEDALISAETQGRIMEIAGRGAFLNEGDVIARIDDRMIQAQFNAAKTAYELAVENFNRMEALHADTIISTQDLQSVRAQRDQARAQLDQAEKQLRDSNIEAPFSGRVEERMIQRGEHISPGMPVARLVNTEDIRILTGIPERYSGEITEGSPVEIRIRSSQNEPIQSSISYAGNVIDPDTRTFTAEIELENPDRILIPEMVVELRVKRQTIEDAMIIPRTAVVRSEEGISVFKAVEDGDSKKARLTPVQTGRSSGPLIEITSGIEPGDEVVFSGISNLNEGDRLNILNTETSVERSERLAATDRPFVSY